MSLGNIIEPRVTLAALQDNFPERKNTITEEHVLMLNKAIEDPDFNLAMMMDEMVSYRNVMLDNSMSMSGYIRAVKFVSYLPQTNWNVTETYRRAFPNDQVVIDARGKGADSPEGNTLTAQAVRYSRTAGVKQLQIQSDLPLDFMLMGERMKMLTVLSEEALSAGMSKDRIAAADKFLVHTKTIETSNVRMEVGPTQEVINLGSVMEEQLGAMMKSQRLMLQAGVAIEEVQKIGVDFGEMD